ncbi:Structural maintenance of chromosomes protein 2, partial [Cladochytrium tenue]
IAGGAVADPGTAAIQPSLDKVDSELGEPLDESHTQNIGQLLRSRFCSSQFVLVSVMDGMYSNANVLFRDRFRDGVSTVERHAQSHLAAPVFASGRRRIFNIPAMMVLVTSKHTDMLNADTNVLSERLHFLGFTDL